MPAGSNAYNSLWQVRTDAWSTLEESTAQLALADARQRPVEGLTDTVAEALEVLAPRPAPPPDPPSPAAVAAAAPAATEP
jgi:hypothetical protein